MAFVVLMEYTALYCPEPHAALHESPLLYFCIIAAHLRTLNLPHYVLGFLSYTRKVVCLPPSLPGSITEEETCLELNALDTLAEHRFSVGQQTETKALLFCWYL